MKKVTQKAIKAMIKSGEAIDITNANDTKMIPCKYEKIAYSVGMYGQNGAIYKAENGKIYATTSRGYALFAY